LFLILGWGVSVSVLVQGGLQGLLQDGKLRPLDGSDGTSSFFLGLFPFLSRVTCFLFRFSGVFLCLGLIGGEEEAQDWPGMRGGDEIAG
jgi:hypothetical protein